jgi:hypothetical protein
MKPNFDNKTLINDENLIRLYRKLNGDADER